MYCMQVAGAGCCLGNHNMNRINASDGDAVTNLVFVDVLLRPASAVQCN